MSKEELWHLLYLLEINGNPNIKFGFVADKPDERDFLYKTSINYNLKTLPSVDLRPFCPVVANQRTLGACTAFAVTSMIDFVRDKQQKVNFIPSALFTYYTTRQIENTVNYDSGAEVRNAIKSAAVYGTAPRRMWPYQVSKFKQKPPQKAYNEALKHQAISYYRIPNGSVSLMQTCLHEGYPFVFGMYLYSGFMSTQTQKTGIVEMPTPGEIFQGGHCMMGVGTKQIFNKNYFIVQNSWGLNWGDKGYCYVPFEYFADKNLSVDFWTIRIMES